MILYEPPRKTIGLRLSGTYCLRSGRNYTHMTSNEDRNSAYVAAADKQSNAYIQYKYVPLHPQVPVRMSIYTT